MRLAAMLLPAVGTFALYHERGGVGGEALRQREHRHVYVIKTEGALARLAIKMYVPVLVVACAAVGAKFVVEYSTPVLKGVYHVVFEEKGEHAEDARLVHVRHQRLHR